MSTRPSSSLGVSRFYNPTPLHLRALVLDYLCHNAYTKTARVFARTSRIPEADMTDSPELSEEVLHQIELREQIRLHICRGQVTEATEMLLKHFPDVLNDQPGSQANTTRFPNLAALSLEPAHLSLNLKILAFIEALRTHPLPPCPSSEPEPEPLSDSDRLRKHADLLMKARKIRVAINMLPDEEDRKTFLTELEFVTGLLAYKVPEESNIAPTYFSQDRREAVAVQINSAILYRTKQPAVSYLESYTRHTTTVWSIMNQLNVKPPPTPHRPPGARLPPTTEPSVVKTMVKGAEPETLESVPSFDLQQFLDVKT